MSMIYESMRNKGGLVLVPASALETMNLGTVLGTRAYHQNLVNEGADESGEAVAETEKGAPDSPPADGDGGPAGGGTPDTQQAETVLVGGVPEHRGSPS